MWVGGSDLPKQASPVRGCQQVLAAVSFKNFGWRQYGRLMTDYRQKDVAIRKWLFQAKAILRTVCILDMQVTESGKAIAKSPFLQWCLIDHTMEGSTFN